MALTDDDKLIIQALAQAALDNDKRLANTEQMTQRIANLESVMDHLVENFGSLHAEVTNLRSDVSQLSTDLRSDLADLSKDVAVVDERTSTHGADIKRLEMALFNKLNLFALIVAAATIIGIVANARGWI